VSDERDRPGRDRRDTDGIRREWAATGRVAAWIAAVGLFVGTVLYLVDSIGLIGSTPRYHATSAGHLRDEARFWSAMFAHRRDILWDIWARDLIFPIAFGALIVVSLAVRYLAGRQRPEADLMTTFILIGGTISALSDLLFLGSTEYWRTSGWTATPAALMVSVGRDTQTIDSLVRWPEAGGFVALAVGITYLGRLCRREVRLPNGLGLLSYLEAACLAGIALAGLSHLDTPYDIFSLVAGAVIGPALAIWLASMIGRLPTVAGEVAP
jgi:hypothetical protein